MGGMRRRFASPVMQKLYPIVHTDKSCFADKTEVYGMPICEARECIYEHIRKQGLCLETARELCTVAGLQNPNGARYHLKILEAEGRIKRVYPRQKRRLVAYRAVEAPCSGGAL